MAAETITTKVMKCIRSTISFAARRLFCIYCKHSIVECISCWTLTNVPA